MNNQEAPTRSWLERLSDALMREPQDREQLVNLLRDAEQRRLLDAHALGMIEGVLQVSEMQVRDIMIPRAQMVVVEMNSPSREFLPIITQSGHSRFPLIGQSRDEVLGILLAKDLLRYPLQDSDAEFNFRDIMRPVTFVPESKHLDTLLEEFRANRHHMAIVVDEYGGVAGLVTIEDVLEQIVGEIVDEHDIDEDVNIKQLEDGHYTIKALTPIEEFNEHFESAFSDDEFDTVGGLVMHAFGHLPKRGEQVSIANYNFSILNADSRRIRLLKVVPTMEDVST